MTQDPIETIKAMPGNLTAKAKQLGISPGYLSDLLKGHRQPGNKVLKALGLRIVYLPEDRPQGL